MPLLRLFALGHLQFFSALFISKYFDFAFVSSYGLLILMILQALSLWTNLWQSFLYRHRFVFIPGYILCLLLLSFSSTAMPGLLICLAVLFMFSLVQSEIIQLFRSPAFPIRQLYAAELIGGIFGVLNWYFLSAQMGFSGFAALATATVLSLYFFEKPIWRIIPAAVAAVLVFLMLQTPQPIVNKRNRQEIVNAAKVLETKWEPNGVVELVPFGPSKRVLLFDGGELRSHIHRFDGNFEVLRAEYLKSKPIGVWGLDVVLPHFMHGKSDPKVALISAIGGQELLAAKAFRARDIDAIEINLSAQMMMTGAQNAYAGGIYDGVRTINDDGRRFIAQSEKQYDVIQIYSSDTAAFSSAFGALFQPSSLVTADALRIYDEHLLPDGILQITTAPGAKLVSTFRAAFPDGQPALQDRLFIYNRARDDSLVSVAYKKSGWSETEVLRMREWLGRDRSKRWRILRPDDFPAPGGSADFFTRPSTDNWPFFRIAIVNEFLERIAYLALALGLVGFLYWVSARRVSMGRELGQRAFWMGVSYSMAQSLSILSFQKIFGLPGLGLSLALGSMLFVTALAALIAELRIFGSFVDRVSSRASVFVAIAMTPIYLISPLWVLLPLGLLILLQSIYFVRMMRQSIAQINFVLWTNGLGFMIGLFIFNLVFAIFGLWQSVVSLSATYLFISRFATSTKSADR